MKNFKKLSLLAILSLAFFPFVKIDASEPEAIEDLKCVYGELTGSLFLTWSEPEGNPESYDIRYYNTLITEENFEYTRKFDQNFSGYETEGLVLIGSNFRTETKYWYVAMKSENEDGISKVSNVVYCYVPETSTQRGDNIAPETTIENPEDGEKILEGKNYTIKGTSQDFGGSSVQKVEISFDGGKSWKNVVAKASISYGFEWEYEWQNPKEGFYEIKIRATDWFENLEDTKIVEVEAVSEIAVDETNETTTTNTASTTSQTSDLQSMIVQIQAQIIQLIQQLIALLSK